MLQNESPQSRLVAISVDPLRASLDPVSVASVDARAVDPTTDPVLSLENNNVLYSIFSQCVGSMETYIVHIQIFRTINRLSSACSATIAVLIGPKKIALVGKGVSFPTSLRYSGEFSEPNETQPLYG